MYLEVYVFNSLKVSEEQIFDDVTLPDFPMYDILRKKIEVTVKNIKWVDDQHGQIEISDFQGQIIFGNANDNKIIYFKIIGGSDPFKLVLDLCRANGWTAYTPENNHFLDIDMDSLHYWQEYKTYRSIVDDVFYKDKGTSLD